MSGPAMQVLLHVPFNSAMTVKLLDTIAAPVLLNPHTVERVAERGVACADSVLATDRRLRRI